MDPFGFGSGQAQQGAGAGTSGTPRPQGADPTLNEYRNILEQLRTGNQQRALEDFYRPPPNFNNNNNNPNNPFQQSRVGPFQQQDAFRPQEQYQQPGQYPQQGGGQFPPQGSPSFLGGLYQGQRHVLGAQPQGPQPVPQPQVPWNTRGFHYSMTTVGPDGRVHHISNGSGFQPHVAGGGQIPVPTVNDFLEMHGNTGGGGAGGAGIPPAEGPPIENPYGDHPLGMMLYLMERLAPIHGQRGDYLPYVFSKCRDILTSGHDDG